MDVERGYEWEEGLFFLEEADPPEEPVTKRTPPDAADPRLWGRRLAEELPGTPGRSGGDRNNVEPFFLRSPEQTRNSVVTTCAKFNSLL